MSVIILSPPSVTQKSAVGPAPAPEVLPVKSFAILIDNPVIAIFVAKIHIKMESNRMQPYMVDDYLKWWRVIRRYCKVKYKLSEEDLDILLFLKTEGFFSLTDWEGYRQIVRWERGRFERMVKDGWVDCHRKHTKYVSSKYRISMKGLRVTMMIYDKLNGNRGPTSPSTNPLFKQKVSFTNRQYRQAMLNMNEWIDEQKAKEQQRHLAPE